ncbi:MAG: CcmD family protein [Nitritalea sp.]
MRIALTCLLFLLTFASKAQEKIEITAEDYANSRVEMADLMRSEGKIYVLVGIILIIFIGMIMYTVATDRKVRQLEQQLKNLK